MKYATLAAACLICICAAVRADDYMIEELKEAAPADELSEEIAAQLSAAGFAIKRSQTSTLCNLWLCKQWEVAANFEPTDEVLYPFQPGDLIGVVEYKRRGEDFREQDINRGVYTLRYAQQPVDGNHEGTSATRDFLLVVNAQKDQSPARMEIQELFTASAEAAESSHPGLLLMPKVPADAKVTKPSIRENDDEWWIIRVAGAATADGKPKPLAFDLVVVGHADE